MDKVVDESIPTKEMTTAYVDRILEEVKLNARLREIGKKIVAAYRNAYKIDDDYRIDCLCYFKPGNKLLYKLSDLKGNEEYAPEMDISCIWNEADLHIAINMMTSDFTDGYVKLRNAFKAIEEKKPQGLWDKVRSWF